jgi:CRISPR-associated protein Csm4
MKIVKLRFSSALHLSKGKPTYDTSDELLHSDTLKSAIFVAACSAMPNKANEEYFKSFHVSSAFPYLCDELFFPKPLMHRLAFVEDKTNPQAKSIKKIEWVGQKIFNDIVCCGKQEISKAMLIAGDSIVSTTVKELDAKKRKDIVLWKRAVTQRVHVPNDKAVESTPFFLDKIFFAEGAGLYFLLEAKDNDLKDILTAINVLGKTGVGLQRNIGNGQFEIESVNDFSFPEPKEPNACLNLSLFCPNDKKELAPMLTDNCAYRLIERGGWLSSPMDEANTTLRKKTVTMFKESSVFGSDTEGGNVFTLGNDLIDLTPEDRKDIGHSVWRDGKAIFLKIKL